MELSGDRGRDDREWPPAAIAVAASVLVRRPRGIGGGAGLDLRRAPPGRRPARASHELRPILVSRRAGARGRDRRPTRLRGRVRATARALRRATRQPRRRARGVAAGREHVGRRPSTTPRRPDVGTPRGAQSPTVNARKPEPSREGDQHATHSYPHRHEPGGRGHGVRDRGQRRQRPGPGDRTLTFVERTVPRADVFADVPPLSKKSVSKGDGYLFRNDVLDTSGAKLGIHEGRCSYLRVTPRFIGSRLLCDGVYTCARTARSPARPRSPSPRRPRSTSPWPEAPAPTRVPEAAGRSRTGPRPTRRRTRRSISCRRPSRPRPCAAPQGPAWAEIARISTQPTSCGRGRRR